MILQFYDLGPSATRAPLCLTCVIEVPSPLVVVGLFGKHRLGDEFFGLVVEVVVEIVPQQQVQEGGLAVRVVAQRGRAEPGVQEAAGKGEKTRQGGRKEPPGSAGCM